LSIKPQLLQSLGRRGIHSTGPIEQIEQDKTRI
jgi:hypothetical protein